MKTIVIGDVHGRELWKEIVAKEHDADRIVFIGDYFDSFTIPPADQLENFLDIKLYKQKNHEKVVLLLGNHDFHYLPYAGNDRYSGYNDQFAREYGLSLQKIVDQMKIVHVEDGYLFSHAGVTNTWLFDHGLLVSEINDIDYSHLGFNRKDTSGYGQSVHQSPIWVRPESLVSDAQQDYIQVVGHTRQPTIVYYEGEHPSRVILTDCHDKSRDYLVIEDEKPRTASL